MAEPVEIMGITHNPFLPGTLVRRFMDDVPAYSGEFPIDRAFTVPLGFVRPETDLPIVPV